MAVARWGGGYFSFGLFLELAHLTGTVMAKVGPSMASLGMSDVPAVVRKACTSLPHYRRKRLHIALSQHCLVVIGEGPVWPAKGGEAICIVDELLNRPEAVVCLRIIGSWGFSGPRCHLGLPLVMPTFSSI